MGARLFGLNSPSYKEVKEKCVSEFGAELVIRELDIEDQFGNTQVQFLKVEIDGQDIHARLPSVSDEDKAIELDMLKNICNRLQIPIKAFEVDYDDL